jgi:uncharacterized membrane protein SirB2
VNLIEHYGALRHIHLAAVGLSLGLFAARGLGVLLRRPWPLRPAVRMASVLIDTVLLAAGVSLWIALQLNPWSRDTWLGLKLVLLLLYIALGSLALKRARTPAARAVFYGLALACAAYMVGVALAHHPAAWLKS